MPYTVGWLSWLKITGLAPVNVHDSPLFEPIVSQMRKSKNTRIITSDSAFDVRRLYLFVKIKIVLLLLYQIDVEKRKSWILRTPHRWIVEQTFGIKLLDSIANKNQ